MYFISPNMDRTTYINPEVVVVEYDRLDDVQVLIFVDKWVPRIEHVTNSSIGLVILSSSGESWMPTYEECQVVAITIDLGPYRHCST